MAGKRIPAYIGVLAWLATAGVHAAVSQPPGYLRPLVPALDARVLAPVPSAAAASPVFPAAPGEGRPGRLREALVALALKLREVRYVRGGRSPSTGFDCSGFVRYVFAHAAGLALPGSSASQYRAGRTVPRDQMQPGDLVFFRTRGRRGVSHVGIYLQDGRFIHAPSPGKSVQVSSLADRYWARRFAGARRPEAIARNG